MAWLDRINERETRRLAKGLQHSALQTRDLARRRLDQFAHQAGGETMQLAKGLRRTAAHTRDAAQDQFGQFAHEAGGLASHAARQIADYGRHDGADLAREMLDHYAHRAGDLSHQLVDYGRHEGEILAREAARQAARAGRAFRADPVPAIVGAIGVALLANLLLGRRSH